MLFLQVRFSPPGLDETHKEGSNWQILDIIFPPKYGSPVYWQKQNCANVLS